MAARAHCKCRRACHAASEHVRGIDPQHTQGWRADASAYTAYLNKGCSSRWDLHLQARWAGYPVQLAHQRPLEDLRHLEHPAAHQSPPQTAEAALEAHRPLVPGAAQRWVARAGVLVATAGAGRQAPCLVGLAMISRRLVVEGVLKGIALAVAVAAAGAKAALVTAAAVVVAAAAKANPQAEEGARVVVPVAQELGWGRQAGAASVHPLGEVEEVNLVAAVAATAMIGTVVEVVVGEAMGIAAAMAAARWALATAAAKAAVPALWVPMVGSPAGLAWTAELAWTVAAAVVAAAAARRVATAEAKAGLLRLRWFPNVGKGTRVLLRRASGASRVKGALTASVRIRGCPWNPYVARVDALALVHKVELLQHEGGIIELGSIWASLALQVFCPPIEVVFAGPFKMANLEIWSAANAELTH
jgi:hypothetical protein